MRVQLPRQVYIPTGATKFTDKSTGAVIYTYDTKSARPGAMGFAPKGQKPAFNFTFRSAAQRDKHCSDWFAGLRRRKAAVVQRRADDKAAGIGLVVGDILSTCWGYDQTNREFFEVIGLIGASMVELQEIGQVSVATGTDSGRCVPQSGNFKGASIRRKAVRGCVTIDDVRIATKWNTSLVAGVAVGPALDWSNGH